MAKSKKITVAITVSILLLLGFIFFQIILTGIAGERLKEPLSRKISQWVNKDVEIGHLSTNIFNSLTINGLKIYQPGKREEGPFLEIRKISARYNIWRLLRTRDFSRSITEITLLDPVVNIRYRQGQWNLSEFLNANVATGHQLPYVLNINNGRVNFHDDTGDFDQVAIKKIQGTIKQKTKMQVIFRFKAITSLSQNDRLNVAGTYIIPQTAISAEINAKRISLQNIPLVFPALNLTKAQGTMSVSLVLHYNLQHHDKFACQGTASIRDGEFWPVSIPDPIRDLSCSLEFDEKNIDFRKTTFILADSSYLVSGSVFDFLRHPVFGLKLRSGDFSLADFPRIFPDLDLRTWNLAGKGKLSVTASGPLNDLKIFSELFIDRGRLKDLPLTGLEFRALWQNDLLQVNTCQAKLAGGDLAVTGKIRLAAKIPLEIEELNASWLHVDMARLGGENITGSMDTYVTGKGTWPEVGAQGRVMVQRISLSNNALGPFDASFKYGHNSLSFSGQRLNTKDKIRGVISFGEKLIQVNDLGIDFAKKGKLSIQGKIQTSRNKQVDLSLTGNNIPVEELSSWLGLSNIYGTIDCRGKTQGSWTEPVTKVTISGKELLSGTHKINVVGDLLITRDKLELPGFIINRYSKVWGNIVLKPKPVVDINFQSADLELDLLLATLGFDTGGKIRGLTAGQMRLTGEPGAIEAHGNFKINDLGLGDFSLGSAQATVVFNQDKLFQGTIGTMAQEGKVHASWWVDLQKEKENKAEIICKFDRFVSSLPGNAYRLPQLDGVIKCTGWLKYNSQVEFRGDLSSEKFNINNQPQELTGRIGQSKQKLTLTAQLGKAYLLESVLMIQDKPSLRGSLKIDLDNIAQANTIWRIKALDRMSGSLNLAADITGTIADPVLKGNLVIGPGSWHNLAYDRIDGLWRCQSGILYLTNLELVKDRGEYLAAGKIPFDEKKPWWFNLQINQAELANLVRPVTDIKGLQGQVQAEVKVTGSRQEPLVEGNILIHNFIYAGLRPSEVSSDFKVKKGVITFETLRVEDKESKVYLEKGSTLAIGEKDQMSFNCNLGLRNVKLNQTVLFGDLSIIGEKEDFTIVVKNFWINQHQFSGEKVRLSWQNEKIEFLPLANKEKIITGTVLKPAAQEYVFDDIVFFEKNKEIMHASGKIKYLQNISLFMATRNQGVYTGTITELLNLKLPVTGRATFNIDIQGRWSSPDIDCTFQSYEGTIGGLNYNTFTGEFTIVDDLLTLGTAELRGNKRYRVQANGTIPLAEQGEYNLKISLPDSSCELLGLWPEYFKKAKGLLSADLTVTGKKSNPVLNGVFSIDRGELYPARMVKRINAAEVKLRITDNKIYIGNCSGVVGDGTLNLAGYVDLGMSAPGDFDLTMNASGKRGIQVAIPGFIDRGEIAGEVHALGQLKDYQLTGDIILTNTHLTYPPKRSANGLSSTDWLDYARWNLAISGGENTWYENELVEVNVRGKLVFTGPTDTLNVSGKVEAVRGTLQYLGNDFRIREAILDFYNNTAYLAGTAEAQVAQDMVILTVSKNKLEDIHPRFTSRNDPQMTEQKVINMLVYGPEINQLAGEEQNKVLVKEMLKIVDTTLNTRIIKPVVKNLGLDRVIDVVRIRTEVTQHAAEGSAGTVWRGSSVSIGKYLGNRFFLGYNTVLEEELNSNKLSLKHQVEMDYHLKGSKHLKMRIDENERFMGIENQIRF
ncbi:MAG: translocation/assembly module TamB domain-containing protein [bacterium]|nr:translocation/assembly module TamB domain-containing protein [bacterium]